MFPSNIAPQNIVVLRPSKIKSAIGIVVCIVLVIGAVFMTSENAPSAWLGIVFFGLGAVTFGAKLLPQSSYLELQPEGFVMCEWFRRSSLFRWQTVSEFSTARFPKAPQLFVVFNEFDPQNPRLAKTNKALIGFTSALPDTYGRPAAELARELNLRRVRSGESDLT